MTDFFSGHVLRPPRSAPANAGSTSSPVTGVTEQVRFEGSVVPGGSATAVEPHRDLYRSAVLSQDGVTEEYLVWAANAANIAVLEDPSWAIEDADTRILPGTLTVGSFEDGTDRFLLIDQGNREVADILSMTWIAGDDLTETEITTTDVELTSVKGVVAITSVPDHLSLERGDRIIRVSYYLAASRFWWTRNDQYLTRFAWNGAIQRWEPLHGGPVKNLGPVENGTVYSLSPKPQFAIGTFLPGDGLDSDAYSMIRVGAVPNTTSTPVASDVIVDVLGTPTTFNGIEVVEDDQISPGYDFSVASPQSAAIVAATSGKLVFNPLFVQGTAGQSIWYSQREFEAESTGKVGLLVDAGITDLFISPVPGPTERPIITIGNREPLGVKIADNDAELDFVSVFEGEVGISLSTGRLRLSTTDITKADPGTRTSPNSSFELPFFGAGIFYQGVTGNTVPQPLREPVALVDGAGTPVVDPDSDTDLYVPDADFVPDALGRSLLGVSGILKVPDGTGSIPDSRFTPSVRPNDSGLVRQVEDFGDTVVFGIGGAVETVQVVDYDTGLPVPRRVPNGEAIVAREAPTGRSRIVINARDLRDKFATGSVYFQQAMFTPSVYAYKTRMVSRIRDQFILDGTEVLYFLVDTISFIWSSSGLVATVGVSETLDADTVAASIDAILAVGTATVLNGHIVLTPVSGAGIVEIFHGDTGTFGELIRDTSGSDALGFLPGWRTERPVAGGLEGTSSNINWLPDNGSSLGVFRTNQNLDRTEDTPDFLVSGRVEDETLTDNIGQAPFYFLDKVPLEDVVGYEESVFFKTVEGLFENELDPFTEVLHLFEDRKFSWLEQQVNSALVTQPTVALALGAQQVVPESLSHVVDGFLRVSSDGGVYEFLEPEIDFLIDAQSGTVRLIDRINPFVFRGARGQIAMATPTIFTDLTEDFSSRGILPGYRLKVITGDAVGSYIISGVLSGTTLSVSLPFPVDADDDLVGYEIFEGVSSTSFDQGLIADVQFLEWSHLPEEPFKIRVLSEIISSKLGGFLVNATRALENGRVIRIRYGLASGSPEASVFVLRREEIGIIANDALAVPAFSSPVVDNFDIRIGNDDFTPVKVTLFTTNPGGGSGVEVRTTDGALKFGSVLLTDYESSNVSYVERLSEASDISSGLSQLDPELGLIRGSETDTVANAGAVVYFVEEMITENRQDATISPIVGSANFATPLLSRQIVEVDYFLADDDGNKALDDDGNEQQVTEFLPLFVRAETCTRVSATRYSFNPSDRTLFEAFDPVIYIGVRQPNYGTQKTVSVNFETSVIDFGQSVNSTDTVTISYGVLEAFGGETAYSTSSRPIYRPPFFLARPSNTFALVTDRTAEFTEGLVIRLGASLIYVLESSYDTASDQTTVSFFPPTEIEQGSRAPGNDVLQLITTEPVAQNTGGITELPSDVAPGGSFLLPTPEEVIEPLGGFLFEMNDLFPDLAPVTYEPVSKGDTEIIVNGDVSRFSVAGHMVDLGGYPFLIVDSVSDSGGRKTRIKLGAAATREFQTDNISISVRPIYPSGSRVLLGTGSLVLDEPFELVRFGETDSLGNEVPGRTLVLDRDYRIDAVSGLVELLEPFEPALQPGQKLLMTYTAVDILSPQVADESIVMPRYSTRFSSVTTPSEDNGLLGLRLRATYSFYTPDSFYFRTLPVDEFLNEVVDQVTAEQEADNPGFGTGVATFTSAQNSDQGTLGLESRLVDLIHRDAVSRRLLGFYNEVITSFEQIIEVSQGGIIGDRDGKFRLFVGRGRRWATPGYEDDITNEILPRNLWAQIFFSETGGSIRFIEDDYIVDPSTATLVGEDLEGDFIEPDLFSDFIALQRLLVRNDVDDLVIVGRDRPDRRRLGPKPFGLIRLFSRGIFRQMADPHLISRLFPEQAVAFTTLSPGSGASSSDPGHYTFGRFLFGRRRRTTGSVIGEISNPVLGVISQIRAVRSQPRRARARIWAYSEVGFPELDAIPGYGTDFANNPRPAIIATPLQLEDLPIDSATGFPDPTRLYSDVGDIPDLTTGDPDLSTPGFGSGAEIAFGRPEGNFIEAGYKYKTLNVSIVGFQTQTRVSSVFVDEVFGGCVLTLQYETGKKVTQGDLLIEKVDNIDGPVLVLNRGDTMLVVPPTGLDDTEAPSDPPTLEDVATLAQGSPYFRSGFDVRFRGNGEIVDATLPSFNDPTFFGLKEITGQNPPRPLSTLEAGVEFDNSLTTPLEVPALLGQPTNDNGDYTLPYLSGPGSEKVLLRDAQHAASKILKSELGVLAQYPDEIVDDAGSVLGSAVLSAPPATLLTLVDLLPAHVPEDGEGRVRQGDLILLETGQTLPGSSTGILSVGKVNTGQLEPPRFITQSSPGSPIGYLLEAAVAWIDSPTYTSGISVSEVIGASVTTTLDVGTTTVVLDDGAGGGGSAPFTGGFNAFFDFADPGAVISIQVIKSPGDPGAGTPGDVVSTLVVRKLTEGGAGIALDTFEVDGGGGPVPVLAGTLRFETTKLVFDTAVVVFDFTDITAGVPHDFMIDVDTTVGKGNLSYVATDRLTFVTPYDLSSALPRGTTHPLLGSTSMEAAISVFEVESPIGPLTVNAPAEVNGGSAFTMLVRDASLTTVGTFAVGSGSIKVMAFEGHGDTPITDSAVNFAAVPSADVETGTGKMDEVGAFSTFENRIIEIDPTLTDLSTTQDGDVVYVDRADGATAATTKAGSYLVRYTVPSNESPLTPTSFTRAISLPTTIAGSGTGFAPFSFPTVVSYDGITLGITDASNFAPANRVFIVVNPDDIGATGDAYARSVVSAGYLSRVGNDITLLFDFKYADNSVSVGGETATDYFTASATVGATVSGFEIFKVDTNNSQFPYVPGSFSDLTIQNAGISTSVTPVTTATETAGFFGTFPPSSDIPYSGAPSEIDISAITDPQWDAIHDPLGQALGGSGTPRCLLPNDFLLAEDSSGDPGYLADAGIYLEPSTPKSGLDLSGADPLVVDTTNSLLASEIGVRDVSTYGPGAGVERVEFSVRRIRRFSAVLDVLGDALSPLRFLYETRRGTVTAYTPNLSATGGVVEALAGTQLGLFDEDLININAGDVFRLLDAGGNLLEEHEIVEVVSGTELRLEAPGVQTSPVVGSVFEVYLKQFPVPHEQSNDELLQLMTDEVVFERSSDFTTQEGGKVDVLNELSDTDSSIDFAALGVLEGDLVIIDPAGDLEGPGGPASIPEQGQSPFGDLGIAPFLPGDEGSPSPLDDNRGYYRVDIVTTDTITVVAEGNFAGDVSGDVILGTPSFPYVVYPTVNDSVLTGGFEGQMDLRLTDFADGSDSFLSSPESIAPFGYKVIRPSPLFERESVELVLMMRERILSWIEEVRTFPEGKAGTYFVFQRDEHITDIEDPFDLFSGLGVPSNAFLQGLEGETDRTPFENTRDALSVLDRRYFILDEELDEDGYSDFANEEGRPVLPDFIDLVLNQTDQLRRLRYAWLDYRTNQVEGTIQSIRRFRKELPERLEEQRRAALIKKSTSGGTDVG